MGKSRERREEKFTPLPYSVRPGAEMYSGPWSQAEKPRVLGNLPIGISGLVTQKEVHNGHISFFFQANKKGRESLRERGFISQFWIVHSQRDGWIGSHDSEPEIEQESLWK